MASASLPKEREGGRLQCSACNHEAELLRAALVVHLSARTPRRRAAAPRGQALSSPWSDVFRKPRGYGLTYTSCQESRKMRGLFRRLAGEMGIDEGTIRTVLDRGTLP